MRLKFWYTKRDVERAYARGRLDMRAEIEAPDQGADWVCDWVASEAFLEFVREQMDAEPLTPRPSIHAWVPERKPMEGLELDPSVRAYRFKGTE